MTRGFIFFILAALALLQVTLLNYFKFFGVKPDLILVSVVFFSLFFEIKWAVFFTVAAGILKDIFSAGAFGINTILLPLWAILIIRLAKEISIDNHYICALLIFISVMVNGIIIRLVSLYLGNFIPFGIFLKIVFLESIYTAAVSPLVFRAYKFKFR